MRESNNVEFRIINASDMPPLVISQNENDEPEGCIEYLPPYMD